MALMEDGIRTLLVAASVGVWQPASVTDWTIFVGKVPDANKKPCIGIMKSGGINPNPKWLLDFPSVQILVRGAPDGYQAAAAKAQTVKDCLLGINAQDISGDRWVSSRMIGDIVPLGFDESNRITFSLNFSLIIEPATGTHRDAM